jgi:hypothetical protein
MDSVYRNGGFRGIARDPLDGGMYSMLPKYAAPIRDIPNLDNPANHLIGTNTSVYTFTLTPAGGAPAAGETLLFAFVSEGYAGNNQVISMTYNGNPVDLEVTTVATGQESIAAFGTAVSDGSASSTLVVTTGANQYRAAAYQYTVTDFGKVASATAGRESSTASASISVTMDIPANALALFLVGSNDNNLSTTWSGIDTEMDKAVNEYSSFAMARCDPQSASRLSQTATYNYPGTAAMVMAGIVIEGTVTPVSQDKMVPANQYFSNLV